MSGPGRDEGVMVVIDVGATKVLVALADPAGVLLDGDVGIFPTPPTAESMVEEIIGRVQDRHPGLRPTIVGCAAPGPLDAERGVVRRMHNRDWVDVDLGHLLGTAFGTSVVLEDDATAAALGEAVAGAGRGLDPVVYLTVSSGVGAGVVVGGHSWRGAHGMAGEIGHLVVAADGPTCGCGLRGDVEAFAGGMALARRAVERWPEDRMPDGSRSPRSPADIFALAAKGESEATSIVNDASDALSVALAAIASAIDPACIVVGGSVALSQPRWVAEVARRARTRCMREIGADLDIRLAGLGDRSCVAGVAVLASQALGQRAS